MAGKTTLERSTTAKRWRLIFLSVLCLSCCVTAKKDPVLIKDASLLIDAGLVKESGEVIPVARTSFYLLDDDLVAVLWSDGGDLWVPTSKLEAQGKKETRMPWQVAWEGYKLQRGIADAYNKLREWREHGVPSKPTPGKELLDKPDSEAEKQMTLYLLARVSTYPDEYKLSRAMSEKANSVIRAHALGNVTTDFTGKAQINNLARRSVYLYGVYFLSDEVALWNQKMDLKEGENRLTLDNNNTAMLKRKGYGW